MELDVVVSSNMVLSQVPSGSEGWHRCGYSDLIVVVTETVAEDIGFGDFSSNVVPYQWQIAMPPTME